VPCLELVRLRALGHLARLARELGAFPISRDLSVKRRQDPSFPRFVAKRINSAWFELEADDVAAFKSMEATEIGPARQAAASEALVHAGSGCWTLFIGSG